MCVRDAAPPERFGYEVATIVEAATTRSGDSIEERADGRLTGRAIRLPGACPTDYVVREIVRRSEDERSMEIRKPFHPCTAKSIRGV